MDRATTGSGAAERIRAAWNALRGMGDAPAPAAAADDTPSAAEEPLPADPVAAAIEVLRETPLLEVQRRGFHFQPCDFYSPLNDLEFLDQNRDLWHRRPMPPAVDWDLPGQLETIRRIAPYCEELAAVPDEMPPGPPRYHWRNDFWGGLDALVQYGLVREAKPRRVVEVGRGWSSLLLAEALARNEGDVCFYDGSHVARPASDVVWFFFEVLPRLRPGVLAHVHDIFWPADYPDEWIFERGQTWRLFAAVPVDPQGGSSVWLRRLPPPSAGEGSGA
ncbi:MAG TPA: class I SAM-dependent methyltransferase [Solirubrobacterales bacterium]|nr:class I SAM-dependent methyltransferase [Solirubrobacterales bacterium]